MAKRRVSIVRRVYASRHVRRARRGAKRMISSPHMRRGAVAVAGYAWGNIEKSAQTDKESVYFKIPYSAKLGRASSAAILLHLGSRVFKNELLDTAATAVASIAGYRAGLRGSLTYDDASLPPATDVSGDVDDDDDDEDEE